MTQQEDKRILGVRMKLYVILPEVDIGENSDIASPLPLPFLELLVF